MKGKSLFIMSLIAVTLAFACKKETKNTQTAAPLGIEGRWEVYKSMADRYEKGNFKSTVDMTDPYISIIYIFDSDSSLISVFRDNSLYDTAWSNYSIVDSNLIVKVKKTTGTATDYTFEKFGFGETEMRLTEYYPNKTDLNRWVITRYFQRK